MNKNSITHQQFTKIVALDIIGVSILSVPSIVIDIAKQDAWIAALLASFFGLLLAGLLYLFGRLFTGQTLIQFCQHLLGKYLGNGIALLYIFFFFIGSTTLLWDIGQFTTSSVLTDTPRLVINFTYLIIVIASVRLGVVTIARSAEILFLVFLGIYVVFSILILPQIHLENIQPVLEATTPALGQAAFILLSFTSLTLFRLLMFYPQHVPPGRATARAFLVGTLIGNGVLLVIIVLSILALGTQLSPLLAYAGHTLARVISVGQFIERIEGTMTTLWYISMLIRITLYFHCLVVGFAQVVRLSDFRVVTLPLGMIVLLFSLFIYPDFDYAAKWNREVWPLYAFTHGVLFPLLLAIVYWFRNSSLPAAEQKESPSQTS
ncbi:GerAB/ArcD/ProY family transporter [Heliophilum fasciatum]|uniref:Spore germination protein KB n=1 Tax=Heliophilum fasciatum TaxID=35700 RepID=A0A4R2RPI7_9FIRM|nr:endospore germination permease [Heliophilum fasciatum]MCW2277620.1 spore germination protein KB [Heliophilum fasciatum]TCP64968.1 spore germination protein KB [Heliophilum fasciatum]